MIINFNQLPLIRDLHKNSRIVFGGGVYDLLHSGHTQGLTFRKSLGDILVCGLVSDERASTRKRIPVRNEQDRLLVLNQFRDIDYTFIMPLPISDISPTLQAIKALRPDIYVEYIDNKYRWSNEDHTYLNSLGTKLIFDTQPKMNSTTAIIATIKQNYYSSNQ